MTDLILQSLYRYPVKSMRGQEFDSLDADARGFVLDRRWMVVDSNGRFVTQRQQPRMALIDVQPGEQGELQLSAPGMQPLQLGRPRGQRIDVEVWGDRVAAALVSPTADAWLSEFLDRHCRLAYLPDDSRRPVDPQFAGPGDQVGFADGFPFLLISQASLDDLNARLETPLPMLRFRPNLVIAGCLPYAEDGWRRIRIGDMRFRVVKPCSRCIIPSIDFATGERGREPLHTLMGYRRRDNKIYFGQNLIHEGTGRLEVGMPVEIIE